MTVCSIFELLFSKAVNYVQKIDGLNTINVFEIGKDYISLGTEEKHKLYGCKLESKSNRVLSLASMSNIANNIKYAQEQSQVFIYYVKKGSHQAIYVYSFNLAAVQQLTHEFRISRMSGRAIVLSMYQMFMIGESKVSDDNRIIYDQSKALSDDELFVPWELEAVSDKFQGKIQLGLEKMLATGTMYQGTALYNRDRFDPVDLFSISWEGIIGMRIDVSSVATMARLQKYESVAKFGDKKFHGICRSITNNPDNQKILQEIDEESCVINSFVYVLDEYKNSVSEISYIMGFEYDENHLTSMKVMGKTLMLARDFDFDIIAPVDHMTQYIQTSHKKQVEKGKRAWWVGKDISGNHINYSIDDNTSPHVIYTGRTGAGKSRQAIAGLEQILGFDKKTGKALRFEEFNVRYTDVGYTCGNFAMKLKENYPDKVRIYSSKISGMRFSLFNIPLDLDGKADEDSIRFMLSLVNFSLEISSIGVEGKGTGKLSGGELNFLSRVVTHLLERGKAGYGNLYLSEFEKDKAYSDMLLDLRAKGYTHQSQINDITEPEYSFLHKPTLDDVLNQIDIWAKKSEFSDFEKGELENLGAKMSSLKNLDFLSFHSNMKPTTEKFTHIDFDEIKDDPVSFSIIYWLIVKEWISIMKETAKRDFKNKVTKPKERTLFYVDEAHNFFRYETFAALLASAVKEFRKYQGVFFFLSQELDDAPKNVITQIGTKVFVVPPEEKDTLKRVIGRYFGEIKKGDEKVLDHIAEFMMYIMYDKGSIGLKFDSSPEDDAFYKPNHPDFANY